MKYQSLYLCPHCSSKFKLKEKLSKCMKKVVGANSAASLPSKAGYGAQSEHVHKQPVNYVRSTNTKQLPSVPTSIHTWYVFRYIC